MAKLDTSIPLDAEAFNALIARIMGNDIANQIVDDTAVLITGLVRGNVVKWSTANNRWEKLDGTSTLTATDVVGIVEVTNMPDTTGQVRSAGIFINVALTANTVYYCQADGTLGTTATNTFMGVCTASGRLFLPARSSGGSGADPTGKVVYFAMKKPPVGYLKANGAAVSRTTYSALFAAICPPQTFTVTIATPAVFTAVAHGLAAGDPVRFTTTGALPTGLTATTVTYYVISTGLTADAFRVSTTVGGTAVNTSGTQSGVHTLRPYYFGVGDGTTTFGIPDNRGVFPRGFDDGAGVDASRVFGSTQTDSVIAHVHRVFNAYEVDSSSNGDGATTVPTYGTAYNSGSYGGTETRPKNIALMACIKY